MEVFVRKIFKIIILVAMSATICLGGSDNMLDTGTEAPDFALFAQDGSKVSLSEYKGKNSVVLIFYPGDQTPVCTKQLCEIRDDYSQFQKKGAVVFGINPGSEKSHQKFAIKNNFQFQLLIDEKGSVAEKYKAKGKLMNQRTVYVIDIDGKVIYAKRGKPPVSEILESLPDNQK